MDEASLGGRLPLLAPEALDAAGQHLYDRLVAGQLAADPPFQTLTAHGSLIGPFNALLHAPGIGGGFVDLHQAEGRATPLSRRMREVVILSVGAVWEAAYESYAHRRLAARAGMSPELVEALSAGQPSDQLNEEELAAQRFVLELVRDQKVDDNIYAATEDVLGRERLVAVVLLVAIYTATAVMLNAFAVPAPDEQGDLQGGGKAVP